VNPWFMRNCLEKFWCRTAASVVRSPARAPALHFHIKRSVSPFKPVPVPGRRGLAKAA
jgi:hypothetical protein